MRPRTAYYAKAKMNQSRTNELATLLEQRILILDGAMGTVIQSYELDEKDYRGDRFVDHPCALAGNNDLLSLTQPQIISAIHGAFLKAGADIVETNTFNSTAISKADYQTAGLVYELNVASARIARSAADAMEGQSPDKPRFIAGVLWPTKRGRKACIGTADGKSRHAAGRQCERNVIFAPPGEIFCRWSN